MIGEDLAAIRSDDLTFSVQFSIEERAFKLDSILVFDTDAFASSRDAVEL